MLKKIDIRTNMLSYGLFARMIWQKLFNYYLEHSGNTTKLDSFLCDLRIMERMLEAGTHTFYWQCDFNSGWAEITIYESAYIRNVKITFTRDEITLEFKDYCSGDVRPTLSISSVAIVKNVSHSKSSSES